jgi:hypothetical protein
MIRKYLKLGHDCIVNDLNIECQHIKFIPLTHDVCLLSCVYRRDNKVRELATVCIPWQQWTETTVWFDDVYYLEVLKRLRVKVRRKRPEIFANNSWMLHHDNAPAHTALSLREFLASKQITVLEHPPYSPDLTPNDFFLFPKIKEILKGRHFDDIDNIRE